MKERLNFEARYPYSPAEVWRALTDPDALARWLMANDFRPKLGHRFHFKDLGGQVQVKCEVVGLKDGEFVSFTWEGGDDEPPSVVAWTVKPTDDGGSTLKVEHAVLNVISAYVVLEVGMNWRSLLRHRLRDVLHAMARPNVPIPIVYVQEQDASETARVAGLTRPGGQFAAVGTPQKFSETQEDGNEK